MAEQVNKPLNTSSAAVVSLNTLRKPTSPWRRAARSLVSARWPILALTLILIVLLLAIFGPQIAPKDPNRQNLILRLMPPFQTGAKDKGFPLGTDSTGRDVLSQLIYGARISLLVGVSAVLIGGIMGTVLGLISGYFGGALDDVIMRLADIQLAYPSVLLIIMVLVVLGQGIANVIIVLGVSSWVTYARIARAQTISQREKEYVEAAHALGAGNLRIMFTSILPNILAPLIVVASFNVAGAILSEASLSFLGLGVPPTVPTWGGMLAESRNQLLGGSWWLAVFPGVAIMLTVLAINILGDWVRDFLDPRLRGTG